ncbi:MAG: metallophosphoesterase [Clostridia bacterium]|nr:metallophosphoesterase [Clostridia bacterium]
MDYVCEKSDNKRILIVTDVHYCDHVWHKTVNEDRMKMLCESINNEYEQKPFDMILCLGDYSLDFWAWGEGGSYLNNPPVSNTQNFMREIYPKFPVKTYLIPGNHEQYGNEKWKEITEFPRQFSVVYDDYVFLMCDTFGGDLDPTDHSDGTYTGIDTELLKAAIKTHSDKKIILCAHDIYPEQESEELKKIISENDRIICAFTGHTHRSNTVILGSEWRNLPVFYCGDFSYSAGCSADAPNRGYRILDLENGFSTEYKRV